jgi:ABC-type glutathione transport system ATPase component
VIEHLLRAIMTLSDRIVVLDHGEKIAEGVPAVIARDPASSRPTSASRRAVMAEPGRRPEIAARRGCAPAHPARAPRRARAARGRGRVPAASARPCWKSATFTPAIATWPSPRQSR